MRITNFQSIREGLGTLPYMASISREELVELFGEAYTELAINVIMYENEGLYVYVPSTKGMMAGSDATMRIKTNAIVFDNCLEIATNNVSEIEKIRRTIRGELCDNFEMGRISFGPNQIYTESPETAFLLSMKYGFTLRKKDDAD